MSKRQRELILWLGKVRYCGTRGIKRAGWSEATVERCWKAGWIEADPNHRYSWVPTAAGIKEAARP